MRARWLVHAVVLGLTACSLLLPFAGPDGGEADATVDGTLPDAGSPDSSDASCVSTSCGTLHCCVHPDTTTMCIDVSQDGRDACVANGGGLDIGCYADETCQATSSCCISDTADPTLWQTQCGKPEAGCSGGCSVCSPGSGASVMCKPDGAPCAMGTCKALGAPLDQLPLYACQQ